MSKPVVYDGSALRALFAAHPVAFGYWQRADLGRASVVFPATAVAAANSALRAAYDTWSGLFWGESVSVVSLDGSAAVEIGLEGCGDIAMAHVVHEARATDGVVLTSTPYIYAGLDVPVLVL